MYSEVMKGLRFANTQKTCFEDWKRSHIGCSALLYGRLADSQESRFQASNRSNKRSAVLEGGRTSDIHEFFFKLENFQIWTVCNCKGLFSDFQEIHFQVSKRSDNCSAILQENRFADVHE